MTATPTQRREESQPHGATGNTRQATRAHPARCGGREHGAARASVPEDEATWLEPLTCLTATSGVTSRVKLLASVIILPQRNVLELMKTAATIDVLSRGRLVLGVGSGWNTRQMAALGYDFATHGQRMDEMLFVRRSAKGNTVPPFRGAQLVVPDGVPMAPPAWPGHTAPLYIAGAGVSRPSIRRTLAYGDGWMPSSS